MRIDVLGERHAVLTGGRPRRHRPSRGRAARALAIGAAVAWALAGCARPSSTSALAQIRSQRVLRVVTLNAPTTYYQGAHGPRGLEYRLAESFARQLGVRLRIEPVLDAAALRAALAHGQADLAAAQISGDAQWQAMSLASVPYEHVAQLVVQGHVHSHARDVTDLRGARVVVRADSPQLTALQAIRRAGITGLTWDTLPSQADPLERLEHGEADYTVVDANEFAFARHLYPDLSVAFTLPDARPVQWMVRSDAPDLLTAVNAFLAGTQRSGELAALEQSAAAEAQAGQFDYQQARRFQDDIATRLPRLQALFEQAARLTGLDWRLIAAVGYQESKWQMQAVSEDGAQGIMMLTSDAASAIGVHDRGDLQENILGGARYLAQVIRSIPRHVREPDRTWLALAAYNVGYGHLEDARVLTQRLGKNPDSWADVREQLPLLSEQQWYERAKRGYARGSEPARFVEQVRQYLAVLEWLDATQAALMPPQRVLREALSGSPTRYN